MSKSDHADVRDIIGMREPVAILVAVALGAGYAVLAWYSRDFSEIPWLQAVGVGFILAAALSLVLAPGDPLPPGWTALVAGAGPVAALTVLPFIPPDPPLALLTWPIGAGAAVTAFLAVRGRPAFAWLSVAVVAMITVFCAVTHGEGWVAGAMRCLSSIPVTLMGTFFAMTLRPTATQMLIFRERTARRQAERAAAEAAQMSRAEQRRFLDAEARPILMRLATGTPLTDDERLDCRVVEARLRDSIRAPGLLSPDVTLAAEAARRRGVTVILLDDGGLQGAHEDVLQRVHSLLATTLATASDGAVTARAVPPGRSTIVTILQRSGENGSSTCRIELDREGRPLG